MVSVASCRTIDNYDNLVPLGQHPSAFACSSSADLKGGMSSHFQGVLQATYCDIPLLSVHAGHYSLGHTDYLYIVFSHSSSCSLQFQSHSTRYSFEFASSIFVGSGLVHMLLPEDQKWWD